MKAMLSNLCPHRLKSITFIFYFLILLILSIPV
jgi:hypothetical protein